jgi:hypothetical protein
MIKKYPVISRFILFAILFAGALVLSDFIGKHIYKSSYIGPVLLTVATWIMYKTDKKSLKELGLQINLKTMAFFLLGLILSVLGYSIALYATTLHSGQKWHINPHINWLYLLKGLYLVLPAAAVQQLLFVGYPYKKTIEVSNVRIATLIWATLFACQHDIFSNIYFIAFSFLPLFFAYHVFSSALFRSGTLYFPIGIHLGHNWCTQYFSGSNISDKGIFYLTNMQVFTTWWPHYLIFFITYNLGFVLLYLLLWQWKVTKRKKAELVPMPQS